MRNLLLVLRDDISHVLDHLGVARLVALEAIEAQHGQVQRKGLARIDRGGYLPHQLHTRHHVRLHKCSLLCVRSTSAG